MRLIGFQVTNFRSVEDSGWIDVDPVNAFIGVNESGKTNILVPLWKLNPARDGAIRAVADYPKRMFGEIRDAPEKFVFIRAYFEVGDDSAHLSEVAGFAVPSSATAEVTRNFKGGYTVGFPDWETINRTKAGPILDELQNAITEISAIPHLNLESKLKTSIVDVLNELAEIFKTEYTTGRAINQAYERLSELLPAEQAKTSTLVPRFRVLVESFSGKAEKFGPRNPGSVQEVRTAVMNVLPKFLYYSNYGNLDSEIYLPHVVQNLERTDLGLKESAKSRTLKVLFSFVKLSPKEILELGQDFRDTSQPAREPKPEEIETIAERKRERSILLQSASATLTTKFRDWWRQGDYRFRFEADGNHFRIWVSDDRRPDEVELESRSTGLQWFLSFYLVFLVESQDEHKQAILLLDEPGLSLHPLAQRDLSDFFENLSRNNMIMYTTHSPFLVDSDHLSRVKKVYVDEKGTTKTSADLRIGQARETQAGASYAVHSALNMTVSESLLLGCNPIVVEGPSDQHYLTAMKVLLISGGVIRPKRELVFPPSGGTKTIRIVASMLSGRDEILPKVLLDADEMGRRMQKELQSSSYSDALDRVLVVSQFLDITNAEIEDLMPPDEMVYVLDRWQKGADNEFSEHYVAGSAIVGQIEKWAKGNSVELEKGWKVELAKRVKERMISRGFEKLDGDLIRTWSSLFEALQG